MTEDEQFFESKLVIDIDDQLKKKFKLKALMNDCTMTDKVIQWIEKYVGNFNPNL